MLATKWSNTGEGSGTNQRSTYEEVEALWKCDPYPNEEEKVTSIATSRCGVVDSFKKRAH